MAKSRKAKKGKDKAKQKLAQRMQQTEANQKKAKRGC